MTTIEAPGTWVEKTKNLGRKGTLFIISAPSGAGKTTLVKALVDSLPGLAISISYTTRKIRPQEQNNIDYYFITPEIFTTMKNDGNFLEYAIVYDNWYGTSRVWVEESLAAGKDVILEIDWQGARQVRSKLFDTISIYILPPSREVLSERLSKRHGDTQEIMGTRMKKAKEELLHYAEYDYIVMNENFEGALTDLTAIVQSVRLQKRYQETKYEDVLENLLS